MTYNQIAYYILDALKLSGKSSYYNEEHILFLLDKYRSFLLKQKYSDIKKPIPESNFQTICIDVEPTQSPINDCGETLLLKSSNPIPTLSTIGTPFISTGVLQNVRVVYVSRNRFAHVGHNKFLKNMIYCAVGADGHLYMRASNHQLQYLESVQLSGIFQDSTEAAKLSCSSSSQESQLCNDIMESTFPLEDALIPNLIQMIMQDLLGAAWRPKDTTNNDKDDLADLIGAAQRLMDNRYNKTIAGDAQ